MLLSGAGAGSQEMEPVAGTGAGSMLDLLHNTGGHLKLLLKTNF